MQDSIKLLPDALANQIAAGEVVQRPSSVVKELMENSIDAGADSIELIISNYGKALIHVIDNGKGMSDIDARMSFERHATSKISQTQDLFNIKTMGFRGEALASISAVAQVELKTRVKDQELGTLLLIEASEVKLQEPCASEAGTSLKVKNLFYNVPARRNFLKSDSVEMKHIIDEFQHIAMAYPEKSFKLYQDEKLIFDLHPAKLGQRIIDILGRNYKDQIIPCQAETQDLSLKGYIGKPESSKKSRGDQFLFVNNRFIRSNYLHHAILTAFEALVPEKYHPFYALFLEIDPKHIDINVHPTKTEVKFDDERSLYAVVRSAVKQALGAHNIYPSLDFDSDVNLMQQFENKRSSNEQQGKSDQDYSRFRSIENKSPDPRGWENLFDENLAHSSNTTREIIDRERATEDPSAHQSEAMTRESGIHEASSDAPAKSSYLQVHQNYIATAVKSGLIIINIKSATERIIYERLKKQAEAQQVLTQRILFPSQIEFSTADFELLNSLQPELENLGFEVSVMGKNCLVINGIPADIAQENEKELLESIVEQYKFSKNDLELTVRDKIIQSIANRAASNKKRQMDVSEMEELVNRLFSCENPNYTPSGKLTFKIIERTTLENFFL